LVQAITCLIDWPSLIRALDLIVDGAVVDLHRDIRRSLERRQAGLRVVPFADRVSDTLVFIGSPRSTEKPTAVTD
jgi:hypothetical protein